MPTACPRALSWWAPVRSDANTPASWPCSAAPSRWSYSTGTFLSFLDSEIATLLQETLKRTGIDLIASSQIERVSAGPPFTLTLNSSRELKADAIVVAAGRSGNTESLKMENAGLKADARGFLTVNERFQTAQPHIWAAGDVIGFLSSPRLPWSKPA